MDKNSHFGVKIITVLILISFWVSILPGQQIYAQTSIPNWSEPTNVSQTGGTTDPVFVVDAFDNLHVFWDDIYSDQGYTRWDGEQWASSSTATFNFGLAKPHIFADQNGFLHAFWINELNTLLYSRVLALEAGNPVAWSSPLALATSVLKLSAAVGNEGRLYLAYAIGLAEDGTPAGIYVRRSDPGGLGWGNAFPLYLSQYFRGLTRDNIKLQISVALENSPDTVFVVWDDLPLRRVFLSKSLDEGVSWSEPLEIDGPQAGKTPPEPFNIQAFAYNQNVLVLWQSRLQSSFDCTQNYQFSNDLGETWQTASVMYTNIVGCPQLNQFVLGPDGIVFLLSKIQENVYLTAWDGETWSTPRPQGFFSGFSDPVSFNLVRLDCIQAQVNSQGVLHVAGCDVTGNGDTWVMNTSLGTRSDWFQSPDSWVIPEITLETNSDLDQLTIISDASGLFHAFWIEETDATQNNPRDKLYYAQMANDQWSDAVEIITSPDRNIGKLSVYSAVDGNLYLTWQGLTSNEVYFSWANVSKAISPFEWTEPTSLPINGLNDSPSLSGSISGSLFLVYAIPINENRGIYFIQTTDQGETWSEPVTIFNAVANGWDMVNNPTLVQTDAGYLHATWTRTELVTGGDQIGFYYTSSTDGGQSWSIPQEIVNQPFVRNWLKSYGSLTIHRLWEGSGAENSGIWHETSTDNGLTWTRSVPISILGDTGPTNVAIDTAGQIHVFLSVLSEQGELLVEHWWRDGEQWVNDEPIRYGFMDALLNQEISAAASLNGKLVVLSQTNEISPETGLNLTRLVSTHKTLDDTVFPEATVTTITDETPVEPATPIQTPNEVPPTITPTPGIPDFGDEPTTNASGNMIFILIIGAVTSIFVVLIGLFIYYRRFN
jgi:hypothetical protein